MQVQDREVQFAQLLQAETLTPHVLKTACLHGIPDNADLRAEAWRTLLGVVDINASRKSNDEPHIESKNGKSTSDGQKAREASKQAKRQQYYSLAHDLLPHHSSSTASSASPQDNWLDDIDKDVRRTQTSYAFFAQKATDQTDINISSSDGSQALRLSQSLSQRLNQLHPHRQEEIAERYKLSPARNGKGKEKAGSFSNDANDLNNDNTDSDSNSSAGEERHFERLIRMLYIFALLNPVHYVQGMSELIAPLYYVFAQSSEKQHAEADAFWAFSKLMGEIGDFYVQDSDGTFGELAASNELSGMAGIAGLGAALRQFAKELHWIDAELAYNLHTEKEIQPTFYALRWITCLLAMDFRIPDLIRIWDSLFAMFADSTAKPAKALSATESEARSFLLDLCVAMVLIKRHELLSSSFSTCLDTLQNYVCEDVHTILTLAFSIRERRITSSLTGIDISSYSSVPTSPLPSSGDFETSPTPNLQNARQALNVAAQNLSAHPTARALRQRLFKSQQKDTSFDTPDDMSDISSATAPAALEDTWTSPTRSAVSSPASTMPSSASSLFSKYAKNLASSDAAAQFNKMTTNSYITALQWKDSAPSTFSKWKTDVSGKVTGAAEAAKTVVRPPSPQTDPPFTPPTANTGRWLSPDASSSPSSNIGERRGSGPKPLLLSSSARRASATLQQDNQAATPLTSSRRTSYSGPGGQSFGLGLPQSMDHSLHRSRTPSPTTPLRQSLHSKTASAGQLGSYKIGNGRVNGHADHTRAGSLSISTALSPSTFKHQHSLSQISETGDTPKEDDVPLGSLSSSSNILDSAPAPPPKTGLPQRLRRHEDRAMSVLRDKGASNDVEILNDEVSLGNDSHGNDSTDSMAAMSHFFQYTGLTSSSSSVTTPPQSPIRHQSRRSFSDDTPLSPTGSTSGLSRSINRHPRTSSLANINTRDIDSPASSTKERVSLDLQDESAEGTAPQRPMRRKLASSRRLTRRDSVGSASVRSNDAEGVL